MKDSEQLTGNEDITSTVLKQLHDEYYNELDPQDPAAVLNRFIDGISKKKYRDTFYFGAKKPFIDPYNDYISMFGVSTIENAVSEQYRSLPFSEKIAMTWERVRKKKKDRWNMAHSSLANRGWLNGQYKGNDAKEMCILIGLRKEPPSDLFPSELNGIKVYYSYRPSN